MAIDTDDEHIEVNKDFYMGDEEEYQHPEVGKSGPSWNSNNMSFWEMHEEGKTLLVKKLQQQKHADYRDGTWSKYLYRLFYFRF